MWTQNGAESEKCSFWTASLILRLIALALILVSLLISTFSGKSFGADGGEKKLREVCVSTTEELIAAMGSGVRIIMDPGLYDLSEWAESGLTDSTPDGVLLSYDSSLKLTGLRDLYILGIDAEIVVSSEEIPVLTLEGCENVFFDGLTMGHKVMGSGCIASVLSLIDCSDIRLDQTNLYGSGTYGLDVVRGKGLKVKQSWIHDCNYGAIAMVEHKGGEFDGCLFQNCGDDLVLSVNNSELSFSNCVFIDNQAPILPAKSDSYYVGNTIVFKDVTFNN